MSFDFNYKFWVATKKDLNQLIKRQNALKRREPIENPLVTYRLFSELYILYVELVNKLGYIYQNTFQAQKRKVVEPLVQAATRHLQELKNELKHLELCEYVYTDKALIARKLTPYDLVIWRSPQFLYRRPPEIQNLIYDNKVFMNNEQKKELEKKNVMKIRAALIIIQAHERARRCRVYKVAIKFDKKNLKIVRKAKAVYNFSHDKNQIMSIPVKRTEFNVNFVKSSDSCQELLNMNDPPPTAEELLIEAERQRANEAAAIRIQRAWRSYRGRKVLRKKIRYRQNIYGMRIKRKVGNPNQYAESVLELYQKELLKKKLTENFIQLIDDERVRLLQERTPWIMEDISDHIRAWFHEFYEKVGDFHPYPDAVKTGTVLLVIDETMTPSEFREQLQLKNLSKDEKKKRAEKAKQSKAKQKEKQRKEKMKLAKRMKKMKDAGIYDIAYETKNNKNIQMIENTMKQYSVDWALIDEYLNKHYDPIKEWVTETELAIIHRELRALVDEYMRVEFELLREALAKDLKKKYKPQKQKRQKQKKKKKKKRQTKDITADRTIDSLFNELKAAGIIEKFDNKSFENFIADFNYLSDDTRDDYHLTTLGPAIGDVKMVIQECMMGMGEFNVEKPKSLCLVGPVKNGKKLLCNIIASELDAVVINLSPEKTVGFTDNMKYFLHVVMKVAKAFQPTIILIQDVHRVFWKKIPKDQIDLNPRLLEKSIKKSILKTIKKDDKIMLVGTSDLPWTAKPKLKRVFQKIILIPRTDYGTSFLLWLELLEQNAGDDNVEDYAISALAKTFQSYTSGDISGNIDETLRLERRARLKAVPLNPKEFLLSFIDRETPKFAPEDKLMEKYDKWYKKANKLSKERNKFLAQMAAKAKKRSK